MMGQYDQAVSDYMRALELRHARRKTDWLLQHGRDGRLGTKMHFRLDGDKLEYSGIVPRGVQVGDYQVPSANFNVSDANHIAATLLPASPSAPPGLKAPMLKKRSGNCLPNFIDWVETARSASNATTSG